VIHREKLRLPFLPEKKKGESTQGRREEEKKGGALDLLRQKGALLKEKREWTAPKSGHSGCTKKANLNSSDKGEGILARGGREGC